MLKYFIHKYLERSLNSAILSVRNLNPQLFAYDKSIICSQNQSVENPGVAFVKGANGSNELFEKNKQTVMYDEQGKGRTISGTN